MEHPPLVLSFAELADMLGRLWPGLMHTNAYTLPLRPLTLPSGATGYLALGLPPLHRKRGTRLRAHDRAARLPLAQAG